jgi:hypothetical protein
MAKELRLPLRFLGFSYCSVSGIRFPLCATLHPAPHADESYASANLRIPAADLIRQSSPQA